MMTEGFDDRVAALRRFSRYFTRKVGVLNETLLGSRFGLTEARLLYELAQGGETTARVLARDLQLDPAHVSRILAKFVGQGLVDRRVAPEDRRSHRLVLTPEGRSVFEDLDRDSARLFGDLMAPLSEIGQRRLVAATAAVEDLLEAAPDPGWLLRPHRPGDMGWVVAAHGRIYAEEKGFDASFEALVARIAAEFIENFDPARDCCWIAERGGETVGSAVVVHTDAGDTAKLRLVILEPAARGRGIGLRLVEECLRFARGAGYARMVLWTQADLAAATGIYRKLGFRPTAEEHCRRFGRDVVDQTWELDLKAAGAAAARLSDG